MLAGKADLFRTSKCPACDATVDLFTDTVCPWCLVGAERLDKALAELESWLGAVREDAERPPESPQCCAP